MMNGLTVNLHLMLKSFFRPTASRFKILMEWPEFPSDIYAVKTHLRSRGLDPDDALITIEPREGEHLIRHDDLAAVIGAEGDSIAVILMSGVNYFTGQLFDLASITELGHRHGCMVGFDLAHTAGNVPLELHGWDVDFACWCSYKYLNSGPGAVAGCFVHERHGANPDLPRLAGWWGNDPETRFKMHLLPEFTPRAGADGWQLSNPPIMALAPVKSSLDIFDEVGMPALREKSLRLSGYLRWLVEQIPTDRFEIVTPPAPWCGCQVSMLVHDGPRPLFEALHDAGVVGDVREPNVIRVAPVPLYNSYHEVWRFARILATETGQETG
jgi:kynureninase